MSLFHIKSETQSSRCYDSCISNENCVNACECLSFQLINKSIFVVFSLSVVDTDNCKSFALSFSLSGPLTSKLHIILFFFLTISTPNVQCKLNHNAGVDFFHDEKKTHTHTHYQCLYNVVDDSSLNK